MRDSGRDGIKDDSARVLIFGGTTEGRRLAGVLAENGIACTVCVATEYGMQAMPEQSHVEVRTGRLDAAGMRKLMEQGFRAVVDATHPFAVEATQNIKASAEACGLPYLRLLRDVSSGLSELSGVEPNDLQQGDRCRSGTQVRRFADNISCAQYLVQTTGNILLTTGSKELDVYCADKDLRERLYVRVLPGRESLESCERMQIPGSRILALQGPFSRELNLVLIRQYRIRCLVTKESGSVGGLADKLQAAADAGICACVIGSPEREGGLSFSGVCEELEKWTGTVLHMETRLDISLVGIGMGGRGGMTLQAAELLERADHVFGAERLLRDVSCRQVYPYYLAEDILPCLDQILQSGKGEEVRIVILFSGDSGFYSGCEKLGGRLREWAAGRDTIHVRVYPGISSVSYLAACAGYSWQDAEIVSTHGMGGSGEWAAALLGAVRRRRKVFVLTSGAADVREMGRLLQRERGEFRVLVGYQMSYPEEEIGWLTPEACGKLFGEGLYTCMILCESAREKMRLTHGLPDESFLRGEIPMTKEEIREIAVSKLRLTEGAVVYDIGSGTGSVASEIAGCSPGIRVYALEYREKAVELIRRNLEMLGLYNVRVVQTHAPEGMEELPVPTHAFIGGSDGRLRDILRELYRKNPRMRVVATAVSLETVAELSGLMELPYVADAEAVCVQVGRAGKFGRHHLMRGENPVYVFAFTFRETGGKEFE